MTHFTWLNQNTIVQKKKERACRLCLLFTAVFWCLPNLPLISDSRIPRFQGISATHVISRRWCSLITRVTPRWTRLGCSTRSWSGERQRDIKIASAFDKLPDHRKLAKLNSSSSTTENIAIMSFTKITTCLWFDTEALDVAKYYTSIFPNSSISSIQHYTSAGQEHHKKEPGSVMIVSFTLNNHPFVALNGGADYYHTAATSFMIDCDDQAEVDHYWSKLSEGGESTS